MTSNEYAGSICIFAGNYAPTGYLMCDGTMIPIAKDQMLYSLLGTAFGGDGRTTFGLPDFRGRFAMQEGQGINLSNRIRGQRLGNESFQFTLDSQSLPQHAHAGQFSAQALNPTVTTAADLNSFRVTGTLFCDSVDGNRGPFQAYPGNPTAYPSAAIYSNSANSTMAADAIQDGTVSGIAATTRFAQFTIPVSLMATGASAPIIFDNRAPYSVVNYCVRNEVPYPPHS